MNTARPTQSAAGDDDLARHGTGRHASASLALDCDWVGNANAEVRLEKAPAPGDSDRLVASSYMTEPRPIKHRLAEDVNTHSGVCQPRISIRVATGRVQT